MSPLRSIQNKTEVLSLKEKESERSSGLIE